jgi:Phosphodiester glycosidase
VRVDPLARLKTWKDGTKVRVILAAALGLGLLGTYSTAPTPKWHSLAPGMDLAYVGPGETDTARIAVLRMDPRLWELDVMGKSRTGESAGHSAREWCGQHKYAAAINAGMFATDGKTHLGYLRFREHVNNSGVNNYQSVAAFDSRRDGVPLFRIFDLDATGVSMTTIGRDYASAAQNLRLVKRPGLNQWGQQSRKWSEAALGEDSAGRVLFIFSRTPYSMHDLNRELLAAGIGLVAAQHLEGGPEAQLYVHIGETELEIFGSYQTSFREDDSNAKAWPVPNVLAVRRRSSNVDSTH